MFLFPFLLNFLIWWYTYLLCYCTIFSICRDAVWFSKMKFSFKLTQIFIPKNTLLLFYISRIWRFKRLLCDLLLSIRRFHRRKIDWLMYCILVLVVCGIFVFFLWIFLVRKFNSKLREYFFVPLSSIWWCSIILYVVVLLKCWRWRREYILIFLQHWWFRENVYRK